MENDSLAFINFNYIIIRTLLFVGQYRLQQGAGMHYELTYQHLVGGFILCLSQHHLRQSNKTSCHKYRVYMSKCINVNRIGIGYTRLKYLIFLFDLSYRAPQELICKPSVCFDPLVQSMPWALRSETLVKSFISLCRYKAELIHLGKERINMVLVLFYFNT